MAETTTAAIRTEGLARPTRHTGLSASTSRWRRARCSLSRANGAGKTTTIRLLLGLIRARPAGPRSSASTVRPIRSPPTAVAFVPGDVSLWPSLTGAETLHLLGRVHGHVDVAYRDVLLERFGFDRRRRFGPTPKGTARS